jgi:uncharacterized RDD family membrane protein YckC
MSGLDTLRSITTPEGVELNLRLAGPVPRACAWAIDLAIRSVIMIALFVGLTPLGGVGFGAFLIAVFLLEWFYPALCEVYLDGATPGKKSMGLRVVNDDGTPVQMAAAMIRNLLRAADFLPVLYGVGLVSMLVNREFKRLGDLVAQTVVIYRDESRADVSIPAAAPAPPATPLTVQEARAVLDCAERVPELTAERADELARLAAPLIGADQAEGGNARERLLGVANHLVGRARP